MRKFAVAPGRIKFVATRLGFFSPHTLDAVKGLCRDRMGGHFVRPFLRLLHRGDPELQSILCYRSIP